MAAGIPVQMKLTIMMVVTLTFCASEIISGFMMDSMALLSDGFHNLADAGSFAIALFAASHSGSERPGLWGGLINCVLSMALTFLSGMEAMKRLFISPDLDQGPSITPIYFVIALCGIAMNGFGALFLGGHGHSHGGIACDAHASKLPKAHDNGHSCQGHGDHGHGHSHGHGHGHSHGHGRNEYDLDEGLLYQAQGGESAKGEDVEDLNLRAVWLHTAVDTLGCCIVFVAGYLTAYGGYPKADCWGAVLIVALVWVTTLPLVVQIYGRISQHRDEEERKGLLG